MKSTLDPALYKGISTWERVSQDLLRMSSLCRLDGKHCVFGQVVDGLDVIRKVESYGSDSGKTSKKITVADCGQL